MSLISEALKKAQQEREQNRNNDPISYLNTPPDTSLIPKRRLLFIGSFVLVIVLVLIGVYLWFQPTAVSQMQALHVKPQTTSPLTKVIPATVPVAKAETPPHAPIEKKGVPQQTIQKTSPTPEKPLPIPKKAPLVTARTAKKQVKKGIQLQRETPAQPMDAAAYILEGDQWMEKNNPILAIDDYKKALAISATPDLYLKLYAAVKALRNPVLMRAYVDEGLARFPRDYFLNKVSAVLYIRAREFRKAQVNIAAALAVDSGDYGIYTYQGLSYFHTGDYSQALVSFQKSLELNSDAVENYYYIGLIFDNQKQYSKALEYYTAFIKLNTSNEDFKHQDWVTQRVKLLKTTLNPEQQ